MTTGTSERLGNAGGIWFYRATGSPAATFAVMAGLFLLASWIMGRAAGGGRATGPAAFPTST